MKQFISIMALLLVFSGAQASDLEKLPDIAPNLEDQQSEEEIQQTRKELT